MFNAAKFAQGIAEDFHRDYLYYMSVNDSIVAKLAQKLSRKWYAIARNEMGMSE